MLAALCLGLVLFSPSPDRYFADLALGSWKQIDGNVRLEFLGDGSAEVYLASWILVPEVSRVKQGPDLVLPAPVWKNHKWIWKGAQIHEANWEWQLLRDSIELPAYWFGGGRRQKWTFVQHQAPQFLIPPAPETNLVAADQNKWKKKMPIALASRNTKKVCKCLSKINFPDKDLHPLLTENPKRWNCLLPHARLRLALLLGYSNTEIRTLLKK